MPIGTISNGDSGSSVRTKINQGLSWIDGFGYTSFPTVGGQANKLLGFSDSNAPVLKYTSQYYNVKDYGAVGDGATDDTAAIQACITASIAATGNANIVFPIGRYKVNSQLQVDSATVNVNIRGLHATLVSGISIVGNSVLRVYQAKVVNIEGLNVDMNANTVAHYAFRFGDIAATKYVGVLKVLYCDFFNFGGESQRGIQTEGLSFVAGLTPNFSLPSVLIDGCNFYNQNPTGTGTFNYNTATCYGIGIRLGDISDYARIINCNFNYIRVGVWSDGGANADITGCNFIGCFPRQTTLYTYGALYLSNAVSNNGKINVVACKFNHNYGYCVYSVYTTAKRPITITACHFIANATTSIFFTPGSAVDTYNMVNDCLFDRCSQAFTNSYTNNPYGASLQPFIKATNSNHTYVKGNVFYDDATYCLEITTSNNCVFTDNKYTGITDAVNIVSGTGTILSGLNARNGSETLSAGTVTVANTAITANSIVLLSVVDNTNAGALGVVNNAGVGFTIKSSNASDARVVKWIIVEP